jgi:LPS export ABC transporter permease LptG
VIRASPGVHTRARIVVRVPRFTVRFPSLLDRYVMAGYIGHFSLILIGFITIFLLGDFMDLFDDIQQHRVPGRVVLEYYAFHLPQIVSWVVPVAFLVSALVTYGLLARRNEVTAMKAGGISVYRLVIPVFLAGALGSGLLGLMQEMVLPAANRIKARPYNIIKGRPPQVLGRDDRRWFLGSDGRFYNYDYLVDRRGGSEPGMIDRSTSREFSLNGLSVYDVDSESWTLRERLFVSRAVWKPRDWGYELERGVRVTIGSQATSNTFEGMQVGAYGSREPGGEIEPPNYFRREEPPSDMLGFLELQQHIRGISARGFDTTGLEVQLHRKVSFPMVALVMTLIGVPFSFSVARRGALYGIGIAIVVAIVYWACLGAFEAFGNNAWLPPLLAAWAPNLLFAGAGLYLMFTLDT